MPDVLDLSVTHARVRLDALRHNARVLREHAVPARLMAVVKADAYGHGAVPVARTLADAGIDTFAVANVAEAVALREAGIEGRVLVFAVPQDSLLTAYETYGLEASVPSLEAACLVSEARIPLTVHLKIDTGMHRLGVVPEQAAEALALLAQPHVTLASLWTHYATADETADTFTNEQVRRFEAVRLLAPEIPVHVSNSYSLLTGHGMISDAAFVRCGVSLFGLMGAREPASAQREPLQEAMQFVSRVVALRVVAPGEGVSYGLTWRATEPTWVATVGAGYADGVRRGLSNRGEVSVNGGRYPIVGNVCMDYFMIDAGAAGSPCPVAVDDEVILFGPGGPSASDVADRLGTIPYEIACGVGARVRRHYT